jgi:hypothetical protein
MGLPKEKARVSPVGEHSGLLASGVSGFGEPCLRLALVQSVRQDGKGVTVLALDLDFQHPLQFYDIEEPRPATTPDRLEDAPLALTVRGQRRDLEHLSDTQGGTNLVEGRLFFFC